jgi:hypothetical protein
MPLVTQALELQNCFRSETPNSGLFFADVVEESKWRWRCTHNHSPTSPHIELEVSVWDATGSDYERQAGNEGNCGEQAFAVEFRRIGGDAFVWNNLRAALRKGVAELDSGSHCPSSGLSARPAFRMTQPHALQMGADAPEPMDIASSMFEPLFSMMFQTQNKRMQLEALRACDMLLNADKSTVPTLTQAFNDKAELLSLFNTVMGEADASRPSESQKLVLSIAQKIAASCPVARDSMANSGLNLI